MEQTKDDKTKIKPNKIEYPQIYGYTLPPEEAPSKKNYIKVGYTERKNINSRIYEQTHTAAMRLNANIQFSRKAFFKDGKKFYDTQLHRFFISNGAKRLSEAGGDCEWFTMPHHVIPDWTITLTDRYINRDFEISNDKVKEYKLREEQKKAVNQTLDYYRSGKDPHFLWNAKPRFGKTLTAYDFAIHAGFKKVLVATNRPAIANSWYKDYEKFIGPDKYTFVSTADSLRDKDNHKWVFNYNEVSEKQKNKGLVCFFSLQDLKGAKWAGGRHAKLDWVRDTDWDLLIIDEAHEGAETLRANKLFNQINRKFSLYLSGTPFTALKRGEFKPDQIFTWSYEDEQNKKAEFAKKHPDTHNPYQNPEMSLFTYRLSDMVKEKALGQIDEGNYSYDLKTFFQTKRNANGIPKFVHEDLVREFLHSLSSGDKFPFSTEKLRGEMRHTLWLLDRVDSARALQDLLEEGSTKIDSFTGKKAPDYNPFKASFNIIRAYGSSPKGSNKNSDADDEKYQEKESSNNKKNESSYNRVMKGIKQAEKEGKGTITLSCGQLTTGVTVKQWSGVLMLNNTVSPALYMQAAFRAQNPYDFKRGDKHYHKERAYVFDFSPERALEVYGTFATGLESRPITKHQQYDERIKNMVDLFPVISENSIGKMQETDTEYIVSLPQKYKSDKVFEKGFDSPYLINDLAISSLDNSVVETLKNIDLDKAANSSNSDIFNINDNNFHKAENDQTENGPLDNSTSKGVQKLPDNQNTVSEKQNDTDQERLRKKARQIAKVMPSLIFAYADRHITLDNLSTYVPEDVIKEIFHIDRNTFAMILKSDLFNAPVFHQAALDLVDLSNKVKKDFNTSAQKELFGKLPSISSNLVYTPSTVVDKMLDMLEKNYPGIFDDANRVFCDPFVKSGSFLYGIINRLYNSKKIKKIYPNNRIRIQHILEKQIYGVTITKLFRDMIISMLPIDRANIKYQKYDFHNKNEFEGELNKMKFDVVIGNPPYQESLTGTSDKQIYPYFMDLSYKSSNLAILITPAKFLSNAGKTPEKWNKKMLNDPHIKVIKYFPNGQLVFPHTEIKGGVVITLRDSNKDFGAIKFFTGYPKLNNIVKKVLDYPSFKPLSIQVYSSDSYKLTDDLHRDFPEAQESLSKGHKYSVTTNIFDKLPNVFVNSENTKNNKQYIEVVGRIKGKKRVTKYIKSNYISNFDNLHQYKVILPKSNGNGTLGEQLVEPFIASPNVAHTQTFISIGNFSNKLQANALLKYIKSKFCRLMLGTLKVTQHNAKKAWENVPLQDFNSNSDIDWSKSIPEIDQQLYKKYDLSADEINFIETKVQEME